LRITYVPDRNEEQNDESFEDEDSDKDSQLEERIALLWDATKENEKAETALKRYKAAKEEKEKARKDLEKLLPLPPAKKRRQK
jgi:hypothetical protein